MTDAKPKLTSLPRWKHGELIGNLQRLMDNPELLEDAVLILPKERHVFIACDTVRALGHIAHAGYVLSKRAEDE